MIIFVEYILCWMNKVIGVWESLLKVEENVFSISIVNWLHGGKHACFVYVNIGKNKEGEKINT